MLPLGRTGPARKREGRVIGCNNMCGNGTVKPIPLYTTRNLIKRNSKKTGDTML